MLVLVLNWHVSGKLNKPRGVACSKNGEIFVVSDTANQRILVRRGYFFETVVNVVREKHLSC